MSFLEILIALVSIVAVIYVFYSNRSLRRLIGEHEHKKIEDKFILEHIIHTRTSLNGIVTTVTILIFLSAFFGYNQASKMDADIRKTLETKGDSIEARVTRSITDKVNQVAAINVEELRQKNANIIAIESDVLAQKKDFDKAYKNGWLRPDSVQARMRSEAIRVFSSMYANEQVKLRNIDFRTVDIIERLNKLEGK